MKGSLGMSGDRAFWSLLSSNYDAQRAYPRFELATAPADADGPVTILEDARTLTGLGGYFLSQGDLYVLGDGDAGTYTAYGSQDRPPAGVLRLRNGARTFDPDYFIDPERATGSSGIVASLPIDEENVLLRVWDPAEPVPTLMDDYWSGRNFISQRLYILSLSSGSITSFPALPKGGFSCNVQYRIDSSTFFSLPNEGGTAEDVYRLGIDDIENVFSLPGAGFFGMGRLR